jgi:hypothetical protein
MIVMRTLSIISGMLDARNSQCYHITYMTALMNVRIVLASMGGATAVMPRLHSSTRHLYWLALIAGKLGLLVHECVLSLRLHSN